MEKRIGRKTMKSWISGWMAIVLLVALFPLSPGHALAAGSLTVTTSNPAAVAGDKTDIHVAYTNSAILSLNLGALDFVLPAGIKATTSDQINGVNLTPSQLLDSGQRVRLSGLSLALLSSTTTLSLKQKTLPVSGTYDFQAKAYGLNVTVISTTPLDTQTAALNIGALILSPAAVNVVNNPGDSDTVAVSGVKSGDTVNIYHSDNSSKISLTAQSDGTLTVPLTLIPAGGTVNVSLTRGAIESAKLPVAYLAEIVPPLLLTSVYVNNASGSSDTVTVGNLSAGDSFRVYGTLTGTVPVLTSNAAASGQTSVSAATTLTPLGGTLYVSRVRGGLESTRTVVPYAAEVVAALTNDLVAITNVTGSSDQIKVTGLTANDIVRVYATDGTLLQSLTANSVGTAQGTVELTPGGGTVNLTLVRNGVESLALPVVYLTETVETLLASDITIMNNSNDSDTVSVKGLQDGDRIRLQIGTGTPVTSDPASGGAVNIPAVLLPGGGSVTLNILRNTIEGPRLTLMYNPEQVDAPSVSQLTATNVSGSSDTVVVTDLQAGDVAIVYDAASGGKEIGRAEAGSSAASVTVPLTLNPGGGTAYVAILRHTVTSARTAVVYSAETVAPPAVETVTVLNNPFSADRVTVSGLQAGDEIRVYSADGANELGNAPAVASGGVYFASLGSLNLAPKGGGIRVSIVRNTIESPKTSVPYDSEVVPEPTSTSIAVTNNTGSSDQVRISGLQSGDKVRIQRSGQPDIVVNASAGPDDEYSASSSLELTPTGGTLGVRIIRNTVESAVTSVSYSAEIANFTGAVSVVNAEGDTDEFILTDMTPNTTVNVYPEAGGAGTPLAVGGVVGADGRYPLNTKLKPEGGTLSFSFTVPGFSPNGPNNITYGPEPVSPPVAANITATNHTGDGDTVTVTGLSAGDQVNVYRVQNGTTGSTPIGTGTADASGSTETINLTAPLTPGGGTLAVKVTRSGRTSPETRVNYAAEAVDPPASADIVVVNNVDTAEDSVTVNGLTIGDIVVLTSYGPDGTAVVDTVTSPPAAQTTLKNNLKLAPAGGSVTVSITRHTVASPATRVNYGAEIVPPLQAEDIEIDNATGDAKDQVTVKNLKAGDYAAVVSYNTLGTEIDRIRLQASGTTASGSLKLAAAGGYVTASILRYSDNGVGGAASAEVRALYNTEVVAAPDVNDVIVTNNTGPGDTVVVSGLQANDEIRVYNVDGTQQLGTAPAVGGKATLETALVPAGSSLRVSVIRNTIESSILQVPYLSESVPPPSVSDVAVVNAGGISSDTVTVAGLQAGDSVTVTEGTVARTETVGSGTSIQIRFPLTAAGGIIQVSITRSEVNSQPTNVPYGAETIPAPALSDIAVSNVPNTGGALDQVTVNGVTADDIVHVYNSANSEIGVRQSAGSTVVVSIPDNLNTAGGSLYVAVERGGLLSASVPVAYGAEEVEPLDSSQITGDNTVGDSDTLSIAAGGLNVGESVRVYRANGELAGTASYSSGATTVDLKIAPVGETFALVRVRSGIESRPISFTASPESVPSPEARSIEAVNNTGTKDTVTVTVGTANVQPGDAYIVYDDNMTILGRSGTQTSGTFMIPVTLQPTGGSVQVALERRGVVGTPTSVTYQAEAAAPNAGPPADDITVTNSRGMEDPVVVDNVIEGDIVVVYNAAGSELNRGTATADGSLTVLVGLADSSAGTIEVSIIRGGSESTKTAQTYQRYNSTLPAALTAAQVDIVRSSDPGEEDVVTVTGLEDEDTVTFYNDDNVNIGTAQAAGTGTAVFRTLRLKSYASTLKLTVQRNGATSGPLSVPYPAETSSASPPSAADIAVNNAAGTSNDSVTVTGVQSGDRVRVYTGNGATLLGETYASGTTAVIPVKLGTAAGSVRVSIVRGGVESSGTLKPYAAEPIVTLSPAEEDVTVNNAPGTASDSVTLVGVQPGDVVKVYASGTATELGERTSTGTAVTVAVDLVSGGGTIEISVVRGGYESARTPVTYGAETLPVPAAPDADTIAANNEPGINSDTVVVAGVSAGDLVRVYEGSGSTPIGEAISTGGSVTVPVALDPAGGRVTVTIQSSATAESGRSAAVTYPAEEATPPPSADNISVTNGAGTAFDKVVVVNDVQAGDIVRVYAGLSGTELLGQQQASGSSVTIPVELNDSGGSVRVTIEREGSVSLPSAPVVYPAETQTPDKPAAGEVTVTNNVGPSDRVEVRSVQAGDIVRVYTGDGSTLLGQHTAAGTSAIVSVSLEASAGSITVSIERGSRQGDRSDPIPYAAEPTLQGPTPPAASAVTVTNNIGASDTVEVRSVQAGDIIRVYTADGRTLLGQHTAAETEADVSVTLETSAGSIRLSLERSGIEGDKSGLISYLAERTPQPASPPAAGDVTVTNNIGATSDTVEVRSVQPGDIIRVYASDGTLLGQHTAAGTNTLVPVVLGTLRGNVTVTIQRGSAAEGAPSDPVPYEAEPTPQAPQAPDAGDITATNNLGSRDTVEFTAVSLLQSGDVVRVYDSNGANVWGQATYDGSGAGFLIPVTLTAAAGSAGVSITRGGIESTKTPVPYAAEIVTLDPNDLTTTIYSNGSGVVTVREVLSGDTITLTNSAGTLGTVTAKADGSVTIDVPSGFDAAAGGTYEAVRTHGGTSSQPVTVAYNPLPAGTLNPPSLSQISIDRTGNGEGNLIVTGLQQDDVVTVTDASGQVNPVRADEDGTATVPVSLSPAGGVLSLYVSNTGGTSEPVTFAYEALPATAPAVPGQDSIIIANNAGASDTVRVNDIQPGDTVIIYDAAGINIIGQATASTDSVEIPVTLAPAGGDIQVGIVRSGLPSSSNTTKSYGVEQGSGSVSPPTPGEIAANNNPGTGDTVIVQNVRPGDIVRVYEPNSSTILGQQEQTAASAGPVTVSVTLGTGAGSVDVTLTRGSAESTKTNQTYASEPTAIDGPAQADISVANKPGTDDTVTVRNVQAGDLVTVYASDGSTVIGQESVPTPSDGSITIDVTLVPAGGDVVVVITRGGVTSSATTADYGEESSTIAGPTADRITVVNNPGPADRVTVAGVQVGDLVVVYTADGTSVLGQETVSDAGTGSITIDVTLASGGGDVQVGVVRGNQASARTIRSYDAEAARVTAPTADQISIMNNRGAGDTVRVDNVQANDIITIYASNGKTVLGQAAAAADGSVTVDVVLEAIGGDLRVVVTRGTLQSDPTSKSYDPETNGIPALAPEDVTVNNNLGSQDTVVVRNVQAGDIVTVYAANGTTLLNRVTVSETGTVTVPVTLLGSETSVRVILARGSLQSEAIAQTYDPEPTTLDAPAGASITVTNNTGSFDTVALTELRSGDIITVYAANGTTILDRVTVGADPATWTIPVTLLPSGGSIQVSITRGGIESGRTAVSYGAESRTVPALADADIRVVNNGLSGSSVVVSNVQPGDIVTIYAANGTTVIGRGQVPEGATGLTVPVSLDQAGGALQVALTRGTADSLPTLVNYPARVEEENPGTPGSPGIPTAPANPSIPGPGTSTNPVTPETVNPVTPELQNEGEEFGVSGRVVTLTNRGVRSFSDIKGYWAQNAIEQLAALGILDGKPDGSFGPRETLSRAQFTKMVAMLLDINSQTKPIFSDVPANRWYSASIQGAFEEGVVKGYVGGTFKPDEPVSREEMAKILMDTMLWLNPDVFAEAPDYASAQAFRDYGRVGNWAKEPVSRMLEESILLGKTNGIIDPKGDATRAEAAAVIVRLIEKMSENFQR